MNGHDFIIKEPEEAYHAKSKSGEFLSSHFLAEFRKCPMLYQKRIAGEIADEDRPAFTIGRAAHCLILEEPEAFQLRYMVGEPINAKTGKPFGKGTQAYAEWLDAQEKEVISPADFEFITRLDEAVWSHDEAQHLLNDYIPEAVVRAEYCGLPCQIRMDAFSPTRGIVDLKTCDDLTWFEADARRFGYAQQMAFYREVLCVAAGKRWPVHMVAVEKKEPFRCGVWRISEMALDSAANENAAAIARLKDCRKSGVWPTLYEEIRFID